MFEFRRSGLSALSTYLLHVKISSPCELNQVPPVRPTQLIYLACDKSRLNLRIFRKTFQTRFLNSKQAKVDHFEIDRQGDSVSSEVRLMKAADGGTFA